MNGPRHPETPRPTTDDAKALRVLPSDLGSATLEVVILVPALLVLVCVLVLAARTRLAQTSVEQAAGQAARAASMARTPLSAERGATETAADALAREGLRCSRTGVSVDTSGYGTAVGSVADVEVRVSCTVTLSDLALPGFPGERTLSARAVSVLDTFRGRS